MRSVAFADMKKSIKSLETDSEKIGGKITSDVRQELDTIEKVIFADEANRHIL